MDVDESFEGVLVLSFKSLEPEDARYNGIAARGVWREHLSVPVSALENGSLGQSVADFGYDFMLAKWGAVASRRVSQTKLGSGDFIRFDEFAPGLVNPEFLVFHADDDISVFWGRFARNTEQSPGK